MFHKTLRFKPLLFLFIAAGSLSLFTACKSSSAKAPKNILGKAHSIEVFSLNPQGLSEEQLGEANAPLTFHGFEILGTLDIKEPAKRLKIAELITTGIENANQDIHSNCEFFPRHGLRVSSEDNSADFILCYQCGELLIYKTRKNDIGFPTDTMLNITESGKSYLNKILKQAGINIHP